MTRHLLITMASTFLVTSAAVAHADAVKPTDQQITQQVENQLVKKDPDIAHHIEVATDDGVVTLSGNALTPTYAVHVLRDAGEVTGVVKVRNHLTVD